MSLAHVVVIVGLYVEIDVKRALRFAVCMDRSPVRIPAASFFPFVVQGAVGYVEANGMSVMVVGQNRSCEHQHSGYAREHK